MSHRATPPAPGLSAAEQAQFARDGYLLLPQLADPDRVATLRAVAEQQLRDRVPPLELEADTGYPGAPSDAGQIGGLTIRRLLNAWQRDPACQAWAIHPELGTRLHDLLGPQVELALAHHNCFMTKHPTYSSQTGWHRDSRYWRFARPDLVSAWLALGPERLANGALLMLPGSHRWHLPDDAFDEHQFLRPEHPEVAPRMAAAVAVELNAGDVVLFHSQTFHAAGANQTNLTKVSLVTTYHSADNPAQAGTRSATLASIPLPSHPA